MMLTCHGVEDNGNLLTVKRFLDDFRCGREGDVIDEVIKHLYSPDLKTGCGPVVRRLSVVVDSGGRRDMTKETGDTSKKEVSTTSTPQFQCPILKPSNYSLWAIRMQIILEANGLWETIKPDDKTQADNKKDKTAIAFLYQALPEEQQLQITKHKTAKAIWDALKIRHIGEERVQQARYLQIVASIEQYSDLDEMTLEEAIGRLKTYEERIKFKKGKQVDNHDKLMFTRHENKGKYFRGRGRGKPRFSQGRNHENFKEERKEENSHRSYNRNNFKRSNYDTSKLMNARN
ncbi:zinc finger, CCHC-type containing protein [Tanacetum coccineum]